MANILKDCIDCCAKWGILPSSYKDCMTWEEQVMWLCKFLKNEVIPTVNTNTEEFKDLKNWFDNLDVQEEINNKLEEMYEDGRLADIIAAYIQLRGMLAYDTVAAMKSATNLTNGSFAETLGYYTKGDGGSAKYKIREITNQDIIDENKLIALSDEQLVAEKVTQYDYSDPSNPIYWGADPTGVVDSTNAINDCIQNNKGKTINFTAGIYLVNGVINLPFSNDEKVSINGNGAVIKTESDVDSLFVFGYDRVNNSDQNDVGVVSYIKDLFINGKNSTVNNAIKILKGFKDLKILNCSIYRFVNGILIGETTTGSADVYVSKCLIYGKGSEYDGVGIIANCGDNNIDSCRIYGFRRGLTLNSYNTITKTQVLLRWENQTSANFDPYPRNSETFNTYYEQTEFAYANADSNINCCYCDSMYKFIDIRTKKPIQMVDCFYYNARKDVNTHIIEVKVNDANITVTNCHFALSSNNDCGVIVPTFGGTGLFTNSARINLDNNLIEAWDKLTNPADLILSSIPEYPHANINMTANQWYIAKVIANYNTDAVLHGMLVINGWEYEMHFSSSASTINQINPSNNDSDYSIGTITDGTKLYICVKAGTNHSTNKLDFNLTSSTYGQRFAVSPVLNNEPQASSRLLSDYTATTPTNTKVIKQSVYA